MVKFGRALAFGRAIATKCVVAVGFVIPVKGLRATAAAFSRPLRSGLAIVFVRADTFVRALIVSRTTAAGFVRAFATERVDEPKWAAEPKRAVEAERASEPKRAVEPERVTGLPPAFEGLCDLRILRLHVRYAIHVFCEVVSKICRDE